MASANSGGYMIFRPEKAGLFDILRLCLFKRRLSDCKFVETSEATVLEQDTRTNWLLLAFFMLLQMLLRWLQGPLAFFGACLEFMLNFFSLNDGIFGLIIKIFTGSVVFPDKNSADYRTIIAFDDDRLDLHKASSLLSGPPYVSPWDAANPTRVLDACMMASKVVYENEAYIKKAVTEHWQMDFVGFYNCWNVFQKAHSTQAFIFSNRLENGKVIIVVVFRGTEAFNGRDWATDVDLSWISMGKIGRAHMGFMKALGMQDERDYQKGWPKEYAEGEKDKPLAYYVIREKLRTLLREHKEAGEEAHIIFTGHSLGGALAAVFPTILMLHEESGILNRVWGTITYGQPRVGDAAFASFVDAAVALNNFRAVYRYDAVPRVPFDGPLFQFKHFGNCIYYNGWYDGQVMKEEPNKNGFDPMYTLSKYYHGVEDLVKAVFLGRKEGKEFEESGFSILVRVVFLILPGVASHFPRDYVNAARLGKLRMSPAELV